MYHIHGKGTHYEIGFRFGQRLQKHGLCILDNVPFEITQERIQFAKDCIPFYLTSYPEILDEMRGISDGNACSYEQLCAVVLSMYCIMPEEVHCSCLALRNKHGVYFARNSDFLVSIEKLYMNVQYQFNTSAYAFQGNTTAFVQMEDGVNEFGLMIGLTSVYPKQIQPGIHAGMLLRIFLETCTCVDEVIASISKYTIASSQTFTLVDAYGQIACIECSANRIHVHKPTEPCAFVCATNCFHFQEMKQERVDIGDDWFAQERYQTMDQKLKHDGAQMTLQDVMKLMGGEYGFLCQYDRRSGKDCVWSIAYDTLKKTLYRVEGNPSVKRYRKDKRMIFHSV